MPPKLDFLRLEKDPPRKKVKQVPTQSELNGFPIFMFAVVVAAAFVIVYITIGHHSNDTGRITLRSTQNLKSHADSNTAPPITMFDGYEISPEYFEDLTSYECGDTTCQKTESCEQSISSSQYVLVSDGGYCNSTDGREPITTPEECATAGAALNGSVLPGENRTFVHDCPTCVDITDYYQAGPCWITGTSGGLKFNENRTNGFSGEPCGYIEDGAAPSACVCKQTVDASSSQCEDAQCQQPDNMTEFFTQVLREHYGLNNVDNLHVFDDEFSYEFKGATRGGLRSDMLHCDGQTKRLAVSRACQCENGLVSLVCNGESHGCEVCNSGFYKNADGTCSPNQCFCSYDGATGTPATGANCTVNGATNCVSCDAGSRLVDNLCLPNTCFCNNGIAAAGADCTDDDAAICTSCDAGFRLVNKECLLNTCFCNGGTAATGANCTRNDAEICSDCEDDLNLRDDGTCTPDTCRCSNGVAATGDACTSDGATICTECNEGYHMEEDKTCDPNICTCPGNGNWGTYAWGVNCPEDGAERCMSCYSGYIMNEYGVCEEKMFGDCHPSEATVLVEYACDAGLCVSPRRFDKLKVGDMVQTAENTFEPIIAMVHQDHDTSHVYNAFYTNASATPLYISDGHYLYANGGLVLPQHTRVGDVLHFDDGSFAIERKERLNKQGLFHVHTWSGTLIVDGYKTSVNMEFLDTRLQDNIITPLLWSMYKVGIPITLSNEQHKLLWEAAKPLLSPAKTVTDNMPMWTWPIFCLPFSLALAVLSYPMETTLAGLFAYKITKHKVKQI